MNDRHDVTKNAQTDQTTARLREFSVHELKLMSDGILIQLKESADGVHAMGEGDPDRCQKIFEKLVVGVPALSLTQAMWALDHYIQQRIEEEASDE